MPHSPEMIVTVENGFCDGHFPGRPIAPGAVQLAWVLSYLQSTYALPATALTLRSMKCLNELSPGETIYIHAEQKGERLSASVRSETTVYSEYRFRQN